VQENYESLKKTKRGGLFETWEGCIVKRIAVIKFEVKRWTCRIEVKAYTAKFTNTIISRFRQIWNLVKTWGVHQRRSQVCGQSERCWV